MNILRKTYGYCIFKGPNQDAAKAVCSEMYHLGSDGTHTMISNKQAQVHAVCTHSSEAGDSLWQYKNHMTIMTPVKKASAAEKDQEGPFV